MSDPIPGRGYHLSDHDGVEATLEVCRQENVTPQPRERVIDGKNRTARHTSVLHTCTVLHTSPLKLVVTNYMYFILSDLCIIPQYIVCTSWIWLTLSTLYPIPFMSLCHCISHRWGCPGICQSSSQHRGQETSEAHHPSPSHRHLDLPLNPQCSLGVIFQRHAHH